MRYFEPKGFEEYYDYILKAGKSEGYYIDPDACADVKKTEYYNLLTKFLNCREQENGSADKFKYIPPKKAKNTCEEDKKNKYIDDYKIVVLKNDEVLFRLTSDQFGFSAAERIYETKENMKKYPLSRMILLSHDKTEEQKEEIRKQLIEYVKNTRTLGGTFVWPIPRKGYRTSEYNKRRGVGSYIEDRVDLTLWEVKCFYQIYNKLSEKTYDAFREKYDKEYESNQLFHYGEKIKDEYQAMYEFLAHFRTFDNYIEFFMLEPFVEDVEGQKIPIDIISGEPLDISEVEKYKEQYRTDKVGKLQQLNLEKLQKVVIRVEEMIIQRTQCIEQVI